MPTISYDGQSLSIDGRRVWLVSGSIDYPRVPRELWRDRIRSARQAGLNCIATPVYWNVHEPAPGKFNFSGDQDLRHFVELIADEGMFCILRPGPFVDNDWDFGALPPWLHRIEGIRLREADGPFLEACARYLTAVMEQVRSLQVSSSAPPKVAARMPGGGGGPIILMQIEHHWLCHNPEQADRYLGELLRYLRENGASTPIYDGNNFWTQVEGVFSAWTGSQDLPVNLRQLRQVQPEAPRLVSEYWSSGGAAHWGEPLGPKIDPDTYELRLAGIIASAAQFNIHPFHGGTNFGFYGGRASGGPTGFVTTSYDCDAPLHEGGGRGEKYHATKRICMFASHFGNLLAHLDSDYSPAMLAPEEEAGPTVIHQRGTQGDLVIVMRNSAGRPTSMPVLLPDGRLLTIAMGRDRTAWVVQNARLGGVAELTYTNLRPWAFVDRSILVLFGPAGSEGVVAIDGAPLQVVPPRGKTPLVVRHEDLTIVVLNHEQVDAAYVTRDSVIVGAAALDEDDQPVPMAGWKTISTIEADGSVTTTQVKAPPRMTQPRLGRWQAASVEDLVRGESEQYEAIEGPASLAELQCDYGYGWYRITCKGGKAERVLMPRGGDRLHVFQNGKPEAVLGVCPEAKDGPVQLKFDGSTVILADNLGRYCTGWRLGEPKGIADHFYAVKPARLTKPRETVEQVPDLFEIRGFFEQARIHDRPNGTRLTWSVKPVGKNPLIVDISLPRRAVLLVNDVAVGAYDPIWSGEFTRFVLKIDEELKAGANEITLALFEEVEDTRSLELSKSFAIYQATGNVTAKADWAFTPWGVPDEDAFSPMRANGGGTRRPAFYRCQFNLSHRRMPLWLEPRGLSKGQIFLNGHNVGRYFNATASGKSVGPQHRYYLPEPWLHLDEPNTLILFDEHGSLPAQARLTYQPLGPFGK